MPEPAIVAVVGMAAYFTAIVRAPLTGVVLIIEMTGNYEQMLPLLVACFCAYAVAKYLGNLPIYEALLERDLRRGTSAHVLAEPMVIELEIEPGAPFENRLIRELGLPPGCILVRIHDRRREWVPTARAQIAEQHITGHARHHQVQNDQVGWMAVNLLDLPPACMYHPHSITLIHEALRDQDRNRDIVIDDEHMTYIRHRPALWTAERSCAEPCVGRTCATHALIPMIRSDTTGDFSSALGMLLQLRVAP